jgi:hypothetical protein
MGDARRARDTPRSIAVEAGPLRREPPHARVAAPSVRRAPRTRRGPRRTARAATNGVAARADEKIISWSGFVLRLGFVLPNGFFLPGFVLPTLIHAATRPPRRRDADSHRRPQERSAQADVVGREPPFARTARR